MKLSGISKRMILVICIAALVLVVGGFIVCLVFESRNLTEALFFSIGVILTSALNAWKIYLLERTVKRTLDMEDPDTGKNYVRFQYLLRYFLTGLVLLAAGLISYFTPHVSIAVGAVAGVFTMQISIMIVRHMKIDDET
jgi:uncharacterized membrane protein